MITVRWLDALAPHLPRLSNPSRSLRPLKAADLAAHKHLQPQATILARFPLAAAKQWRFSPGTRLSEPVAVLITIELTFTLGD